MHNMHIHAKQLVLDIFVDLVIMMIRLSAMTYQSL